MAVSNSNVILSIPPNKSVSTNRRTAYTPLLIVFFLKKLLSNFVKIEKIPEDLFSIDVDDRSIHLLKENVFIGLATRQFLKVLVEYGETDAVARGLF